MHPLHGEQLPRPTRAGCTKSRNMALRVILGAMKTTPVHDMEKTANVEPLERRRSLKILIQGEKLRRLPSHPLHTNLAQPTKNRLKRQSLNHQYKELPRTHQDIVDVPVELLTDPAWQPDRETDIQMFLSVPGITSKERSLDTSLLTVPRFSLETFGKRSFSVFGPTVWNSLPLSLRKTQCFTTFKTKLKTHLFHIHLC